MHMSVPQKYKFNREQLFLNELKSNHDKCFPFAKKKKKKKKKM